MHKIEFCQGCQAPIIFIITVNKKRMPCQPEKQAKDFKKEK
jgi:hypothetical protein